jgi:hypothetical protein
MMRTNIRCTSLFPTIKGLVSDFPYTRALSTSATPVFSRLSVDPQQLDFQPVAQHMYTLMLRNVASDGFPFTDSIHTLVSKPGYIIACRA